MTSVLAWIAFPLVAHVLCTGLGTLGERAARRELPPGVLAPLGACLGVILSLPVYKLGGGAAVAAPIVALLALAGLVLGRADLRARLLPGWAGVAGLAAFLWFIAPVVLTGSWTWLGYNFVNDTSVNFVMVAHIAEHGVQPDPGAPSSATGIVNATLSTSYPVGIHALLASLDWLVPAPLAAVYQPFIAAIGGWSAMALTVLARALGVRGAFAAGIAVVAVSANLAYQYAMHGAFKELAIVLVLCTCAALSRLALDQRLHPGTIGLVGAALAAGLAIVATAAAPYAAVLAVVLLVAAGGEAVGWPRLSRLGAAAATGAATLVLFALPSVDDTLAFGRLAADQYSGEGGLTGPNSPSFLGHLVRALPAYQGLGTWLRADYRYPLEPGVLRWLTAALILLAAVLVVVAVVTELRRRRLGALLVLVPGAAVYAAAALRLSPYAEAKLLVIAAPAAVFAAGMGAWWLFRRVPWLGALAGAALAFGVVASDALAIHDVRLAPVDRLQALERAVDRAPAEGLVLFTEWEEFAKYFGRHRQINTGQEVFSPRAIALRTPTPVFARSFDLDEITLAYVEEFPAIVVRRGADASRPPSNYRLAYRNRFYELWLREPGPQVVDHMPLQLLSRGAARPRCADVRAFAAAAAPGETLVAARRPPSALFDYVASPPEGWKPSLAADGTVLPLVPATAGGTVTTPQAGRYRVWMRGSSGRELQVKVDGRLAGTPQGVNTPQSWLHAGEVDLTAGEHRVELVRPGGSISVGDGFAGELGPVALQRIGDPELVEVTPADAGRVLCGQEWDWIERVRR